MLRYYCEGQSVPKNKAALGRGTGAVEFALLDSSRDDLTILDDTANVRKLQRAGDI